MAKKISPAALPAPNTGGRSSEVTMNARVVSLEFDRLHIADGLRTYRDEVIPAAVEQKGFGGAVLLLDRDIGHASSITFWESAEALAATDLGSYYAKQVARLEKFFRTSPEREDYEIGVFARGTLSDSPTFARVVRASFHASRADEGVKVYNETLIANARKQDGFCSALLMIERTTGKALSISLWNSEDTLSGGEISPYYIGQIFKLIPFVASLPDREQYEVGFYLDKNK
jgi:heme-degrading monooxygenase HmoA